ncbi:MAG: D-glycero-beta-D-manno-heptose 1-phosphate adenylyltransferase [Desulfohalobiaceae bacterium]
MSPSRDPASKILTLSAFKELRRALPAEARVVFTNGCFDLLHPGHVEYLHKARVLGNILVVGLNSDASVRRIKGGHRPINPEGERAYVLAGLESVDHVLIFEQDTPLELIKEVRPHVLVKGGDWPVASIVGREEVESRGGRVLSIPLRTGFSTTGLISRIRGSLTAEGVAGKR